MQNGDDVARSRALKVLIALRGAVVEKTARGVGEKGLRFHFGVHRLAEDIVEGQAKNERTQIVDAGHAAEVMAKSVFGIELHLVSALVDRADVPMPRSKTPK